MKHLATAVTVFTAGYIIGAAAMLIAVTIGQAIRRSARSDAAEAHLELFHHAWNAHRAYTDKTDLELFTGDTIAAEVELADRMAVLGATLAHVDTVTVS